VRATQAEALSPNQNSDVMAKLMLPSPSKISALERSAGLSISLQYAGNDQLKFPHSDEQSVSQRGNQISLNICAACGESNANESTPVALAAAKMPSPWLQSDDAGLRALAEKAVRGAKSDLARMQALEQFVRGYIVRKDLSVGYASALDTLGSKAGDCTEHALLLAAMGRAVGIATRVASGFAYAESYGGQRQIFVPHAWAQAYVDGKWRSFDAALQGFDSGHILTGYDDGDPYRFFGAQRMLGTLKVTKVAPLRTAEPR
jgi:hypothetical protein